MTDDDIKATLARLHAELEQAPPLDQDLRELLREVDADIHALLHDAGPGVADGVRARLERLATDLAARHPTTERILRELIDALGRMGI
jgi:hypothetical protein